MMQKLPEGVRVRKSGLMEKRFTINGCRCSVYGRSLRQLKQQEQEKRQLLASSASRKPASLTTDAYFDTWLSLIHI